MFNLPFTEFDILRKEDGSSGLTVREFDILFFLHKTAKDASEAKITLAIKSTLDHVRSDLKKLIDRKFITMTANKTFLCTKRGELLALLLEFYNRYAELLVLEETSERDIVHDLKEKIKLE